MSMSDGKELQTEAQRKLRKITMYYAYRDTEGRLITKTFIIEWDEDGKTKGNKSKSAESV